VAGDAKYTTISMRKLAADATTEPMYGSPQYTTITSQRLANDATSEIVSGDPSYGTYTYQKLASDASAENYVPGGSSNYVINVNFNSGSAVLSGGYSGEISRAVDKINSMGGGTIVGHTDSQGNDAANMELSRNRAKAVYDALVAAGANASSLNYDGRGETQPKSNNGTADGRRANRRVELVLAGGAGEGDGKSYSTRTFQRLVNDASSENVTGDAKYTTISMKKLANDAAANNTSGEPQYTTRSYQKLASDASSEGVTGDPKYTTISMQKLVNDAAATNVSGDPQYTTRSYQKLVTPATTQNNAIEAKYENRSYTRTAPATTRVIEIPAEYRTVTKRQLVKAGGFTEWRTVVCDTDMTPQLVRKVQSALIAKGYNVGSAGADNRMGTATKEALVKFQKDNGLPIGQMDYETLRALGIQ